MATLEQTLKDKVRFEQELEFVQCLANPDYLKYLAHNLYLEDERFLDYLRYLQYWKEPKYNRFLLYPACLQALDLLLSNPKEAAQVLKDPNTVEKIRVQQFYEWQYS